MPLSRDEDPNKKLHFNPEKRTQALEPRGKSGQVLGQQQTPPKEVISQEKTTLEPADGFLSAVPSESSDAKGAEISLSIADVQLNSDGKEAAKIIRESVTGALNKPPAGTTGPLMSAEADSPFSDVFANETALLNKEHPHVQDLYPPQDWNISS